MGALLNAFRVAKAVAPQIAASPLHARSIIRRHLSGQALAALIDLIDISDDGPVPQPQPAYNTMAPGTQKFTVPPPGTTYNSMAPQVPYRSMAPQNGGIVPQPLYGSMAPQQVYASLTPRPLASSGPAMPPAAGLGSSIALPDLAAIPQLKMPDSHRTSDQSKNVKYVADISTRFQKYSVTMHKTVLRRGIALDTEAVKSHFMDVKKVFAGIACMGHDANDHHARFSQLANEWGYQALIWVCVREAGCSEPVFYSHMGKADRFHHSSFTCGGDVIAAGEWIVKRGHLSKISPNSGHYRPPLDYFHRAVLFMNKAWNNDTVVLLWNIKKDTYEEVPVQVFCKTPSGGGIWKASPKS